MRWRVPRGMRLPGCDEKCLRCSGTVAADGESPTRAARAERRSGRAGHPGGTGRGLAFFLRLSCFAILAGCAANPPTLDDSPLEQPGAPQAIAVVPARYAPESNFATFKHGYAGGLAVGAAGGALAGAWLGWMLAPLAVLGGPAGIAAMPAIIAGAAGIGVLGGAAVGVSAVVPEAQATAIDRLANAVVAGLQLPEFTADAIVANAAQFTPYRVERVDGVGPTSRDHTADYRVLRGRGFDAAIEVRVVGIGFAGGGGADPELAVFVDAEARLVDTASGHAVWARGLAYESPRRPASAWSRDEASLARAEITRACRALAERVVESALLQAEFWVGSATAMAPHECGIVPMQPTPVWQTSLFGPRRPATPIVESLAPLLAWERFPYARREFGAMVQTRGTDLRYDLRIWKADDAGAGALVYERYGLTATEHRVQVALDPDSTYFWSVRLRYGIDGHPRATRWGAANEPAFVPSAATKAGLFYAQPAHGAVTPVACRPEDLTPCGCLDFLPPPNRYRFRTPGG